ncbi:MAG: DUF962 domain-containing protein [Alphaproteobacteria bacterium]|nr:DUF962 domain-containing protein [Alphaproteobacteria bacterium]
MKSLAEQMAVYAAYHRDKRNRATHYLGVPAIAFAILIPMGWLWVPVGALPLSFAFVFIVVVLAYYIALDVAVGRVTAALFLPLFVLAQWVALLPWQSGLAIFAIAFVGGWIVQLIGHIFEGRRPALADNLFQILIAPLFLVVEAMVALGLKRDLDRKVRELVPRHLAGGG